ncbi:LysR family transcriptional regulator, partial [Rhizobium johnstonii]
EAVQWPLLHNSDPGSIWMREIIFQEASRMEAPAESSADIDTPMFDSVSAEWCAA